VGVVADVRSGGSTAETFPEIYTPMTQTPSAAMALVMDTKLKDAARVTNDLRDAVGVIDRGIPLERVATYGELLATQLAPRRYQMLLLDAFAGLALLLAAVGLYGVVSYAVTQRKGEIGLRMAFGASGQDVIAMVLRQAFLLAGSGLGILHNCLSTTLCIRILSAFPKVLLFSSRFWLRRFANHQSLPIESLF
jgi:hypothetical protein